MTGEEQHAQEVIQQMRAYCNRLDEMMTLLADKRSLSRDEKEHLRELLTSLKADLKADAHRVSPGRGEEELSQIEQAFFAPAVRKAAAFLTPKTNSDPLRSDWFTHLYSVHLDINHLLRQLERKYFPDDYLRSLQKPT